MGKNRVAPASLIPAAFQTMSLTNSTAQAINSTVRAAGAQILYITVETNNARMRADGTNPTLTTGLVFQKDAAPYPLEYNGTSLLKFQRTTGTCKVSIHAFKYD